MHYLLHLSGAGTAVAAGTSGGGRLGGEAEDEVSKLKKPKMSAIPETVTDQYKI